MPTNRHSAFTLIEILVTVSIIGILAAILLPTLSKGKLRAKSAVCMNNLKQMATAYIDYSSGNRHTLPYDGDSSNTAWMKYLSTYHGFTEESLNCPMCSPQAKRRLGGSLLCWNSEAQVTDPKPPSDDDGKRHLPGILACYHFDENLEDSSGNDYHLEGGALKATDDRNSQSNKAAKFKSDAYESGLPRIYGNFAYAFWVNPKANIPIVPQSVGGPVPRRNDHWSPGLDIKAYRKHMSYVVFPDWGGTGPSPGPDWHWINPGMKAGVGIAVGRNGIQVVEHKGHYMPATLVWQGELSGWTHVALVVENHVPHLYVNGDLAAERPMRSGLDTFLSQSIGINREPHGYSDHELDDLLFFERALNEAEIKMLFNGNVKCGPPAIRSGNYGSYAINAWAQHGNPLAKTEPHKFYDVWEHGSSEVPIFSDAIWADVMPRTGDDSAPTLDGADGGMARMCIDRHPDGINVAFMDGSVRTIKLPDLWSLKWHKEWKTPQHPPLLPSR
jgi:prepilin-type N-terminal cleavage/methylation domain-containing protein/prepilin-type processing-associated H-X9-DG protein